MSANLIIGSSHALYFAWGVGQSKATWQEASTDIIKIESADGGDTHVLFTTNKPSFVEVKRNPAGELVTAFGPLMEKVRRFNRADSKVIFGIGGNEHNVRFLCAQAKPFDFHHPAYPVTDPARQPIPLGDMRAIMRAALQQTLTVTRIIAAELPLAQRYYLAPPPPIPDDDHLRRHAEIFNFEIHGVEDAGVRLKIHRLYLEIVSSFCAETGINFIPPPVENQDEQGFLREAYWEGCTHASTDYYRGVISDLGL